MPDWLKNIKPPKPGTTDTRVRQNPSGPSKKTRDEYIRKVKETVKKNEEKKSGG